MWDGIVKILAIIYPDIKRTIESVTNSKSRKERAELASHLVQLFSSISEISFRGRQIDRLLALFIAENSVERRRSLVADIKYNLRRQIEDLVEMDKAIFRKHAELLILAGSTWSELSNYFDEKSSLLTELAEYINISRLPTEYKTVSLTGRMMSREPYIVSWASLEEDDKGCVADNSIDSLRKYKEDGVIRQSVDGMDELLNKLRVEIGKSFTTEELLSAIQTGRQRRTTSAPR